MHELQAASSRRGVAPDAFDLFDLMMEAAEDNQQPVTWTAMSGETSGENPSGSNENPGDERHPEARGSNEPAAEG